MLIVNALRYAEHSRAGHYIAGRTNHRFVRYITASTTCKIVVRHWRLEPSTTLITDFTCAFPATGLALRQTCQSGLWRSGSKVSSFEMIAGNNACGKYVYSKAYCPAGKQLISGGYQLSNWNGGNGWNTPDISMPSASENAWQIVTGGGVTGGTCMRAIAWCAKN
ncbi:hypothetical protein SO268_004446 [Salmonella enterica]|nr:hypothetical protein [Salmonella enterica]ELY8989298.1 hypothetical protein [Salmonella enterica]